MTEFNSELDLAANIPTRSCATCACSSVQKSAANPLEQQMFCRRDTALAQLVRVDRPVIRDGKPVMMRDGKTPMVQAVQEMVFVYRPTLPNLVCFDGWRPFGTQPGDKSSDAVDGIMANMKRLFNDVITQGQEAALDKIPDGESGTAIGDLLERG